MGVSSFDLAEVGSRDNVALGLAIAMTEGGKGVANREVERLVRGALAGALATAPMSVIIAAGREARLLSNPPPKEIVERTEEKTGTRDDLAQPLFHASWIAAHLGYGAGTGAVYALLDPFLPVGTTGRGLAFGAAVWAVSYLGVMPGLGLYPWPRDDSQSRMAVMILAHAVYGLAIAETVRRLDARGRSGPIRR